MNVMMSKLFLLLIFLSCSDNHKNIEEIEKGVELDFTSTLPFNFKIPDETIVLDRELTEVSGLAYDAQSNTFLCHNDEQSKVYYLDKYLQPINSRKWGRKGDFEAIEIRENIIYFLKSNGTLYLHNQTTQEVEILKTPLKNIQESEGLCFDYQSNNTLLIACKGNPLKSKDQKNTKCIYSYDINKQSLNDEPKLTISIDTLVEFKEKKLKKKLSSKQNSKLKKFAPSAIAVDPFSGDYYIASARGSLLIIYDKQQLKDVIFLNATTIPQPEGLTFDEAGNLYIATEGQRSSGKIFKFLRRLQ